MTIRWQLCLAQMEWEQTGPEDWFDDETNGDPDSTLGEEDESGFDDMPFEAGWMDEEDDDDEDDGDDAGDGEEV